MILIKVNVPQIYVKIVNYLQIYSGVGVIR